MGVGINANVDNMTSFLQSTLLCGIRALIPYNSSMSFNLPPLSTFSSSISSKGCRCSRPLNQPSQQHQSSPQHQSSQQHQPAGSISQASGTSQASSASQASSTSISKTRPSHRIISKEKVGTSDRKLPQSVSLEQFKVKFRAFEIKKKTKRLRW